MIKIFGYNYTVKIGGDSKELDCLGRTISGRQKIELASDLHPQELTSVILHELIEAINYHLQLGLEHQAIMGLETDLYQALTENNVDLTKLLDKIDK